jgi:sterol desaturase/sphingolipid hydroxylase (fatty acid hydroxylase superfamily)
MSVLILYAIPAFLITMVIESLWARRALREGARIRGYARRDTAASLAMGLGNVAIAGVVKLASAAVMVAVYRYHLIDIGPVWWAWILLLLSEDLVYYWFHRASHEVRLLWAAHVSHHSSTHYNLSTALRQSWLTPLTGMPFWLVLPLIGFPPWMVLTQQAISLLYQYWLHTESIRSLGPLEYVLNTPSHHRVHHGRNVEYLDRNHGGILIIWDRLFGSFEPERAAVDYGLTTNLGSYNPLHIATHELRAIARDVRTARTPADAVRHIFGPPGWSPDGRTQTARQMQQRGTALPEA